MRSELTTLDYLDRAENHFSDFTGIVADDGTDYTYGEFAGRIHQLTHALRELNVGKDDRVAIVAGNQHYVLETIFASNQLGGVNAPLNYRLTADDYSHILSEMEPEAIVVDPQYADKIEAIKDEVPIEHFISGGSDKIGGEWIEYETLLDEQPTSQPDRPTIKETDDATINYTSGTTGDPKGVVRTHRTESIRTMAQNGHYGITDQDVYLWLLPMFHVTGWQHPYSLTGVGAKQVCQAQFDPKRTFEQIREHDVTYFCAAPAVLNNLIEYYEEETPETTGENDVRLLTGGSPPPKATIQTIEDEIGWRLIHIYGLTECGPLATSDSSRHIAQHGRLNMKPKQGFGHVEVSIRVVDDDGNEVPKDDQAMGEIVIRGNQVFDRYLNKPDATEEVFNKKRNGWFHTGDIASWDKDGVLTIKDREKDIIVSGGENISSTEVENVLYDHPEIRKAAVVASPHEKWQETPKAYIVTTDTGNITSDEVIRFAKENLASYKKPTKVEFVDDLPETATGKIQKNELREQEWNNVDN